MASADIKMPVSRIMRNVTMRVDVTGVTTWKVRLRIGSWLLQLAARVIGCGIRIDGIS